VTVETDSDSGRKKPSAINNGTDSAYFYIDIKDQLTSFFFGRNQSEARLSDCDRQTEGNLGLIPLNEPRHPDLNIIFVHGLGGCAKGTWTDPQTGSFWPPWLAGVHGLERARVMSFGYDSSWNKIWKSNNVLDIADFGRQLVNELWLHYEESGDVLLLVEAGSADF
jgi:hypothetical protein